MDKLLRFENIREDLYNLMEKEPFCLDKEARLKIYSMPKINTTDHKRYIEYYDEEAIELVKYKDRLIFDKYGYKFGD